MEKILSCIVCFCALWGPVHAQEVWTSQTSPTTNQLNGVYFVDEDTGFIVGNTGTLLRTTNGGLNWEMIDSNTLESLNGIFFVNDNVGYACGSSGKVIKTMNGGNTWTVLGTGTYTIYHSLFFTSITTGSVVGESGKIAHTTNGGESWTFQDNPASFGLYSINYEMPDYWVTGDGGMILTSDNDGATWTQLVAGISSRLNASCLKGPEIIIIGDPGIILKSTNGGQDWIAQYPFAQGLNDLSFPGNGNTGWIVGDFGKILYTPDFGSAWSAQTSGTGRDLNSVFFIDATKGWAVGDYGTILHYTGAAMPKIIYVDDDNTSGTEDGTVDHPFNTVAEGLTGASAGDTVYVFCGDYPEAPLTSLDLKPGVTVTGEDSACTVIHVPFINVVPYTEHLTAIKNVDIPSVVITVSGAGPDFSAFYIGGSRVRHNVYNVTSTKKTGSDPRDQGNSLTIEHCTIEGDVVIAAGVDTYLQLNDNLFLNGGIRDHAGAPAGTESHVIEDNVFYMTIPPGSKDTVITATSAGVTIQNNTIQITGQGTGLYLDSGDPTHVIGNSISFSETEPMAQTTGIYTTAGNGMVSGNTVTGGYFGYFSDSDAAFFENNTITGSHTGFYSKGAEEVHHNLIKECKGDGMVLDGVKGPVHHNTVTDNEETGIRIIRVPIDLGGGGDGSPGLNILQRNVNFDLYIEIVSTVNPTLYARYNVWDHDNAADISQLDIRDGSDSTGLVNVDFTPWGGLGMKDPDPDLGVEVYPNPTSGEFQITSTRTQTNPKFQIEKIEIVDTFGKVVESINLQPATCNLQPATCNLQLDIADLPNGIYFVRINLENQWLVKKIIKL